MIETVDFKTMMNKLMVRPVTRYPNMEIALVEDVVVLDGEAKVRSFFLKRRNRNVSSNKKER